MPFTTATFTFLRCLARNNRKPWFEAHRAEYEAVVVAPMRELIEEMDVRLATFAPEIIGDPKRSMFRTYRDIRFSQDKSPYKTHAACWFYHRAGSRAVGREAAGGGAVAAVPVVHAGPRVAGRSGPGRATAGAARRGLPADRTAGAVDQRGGGTQTGRAAVAAAGAGPASTNCFVTGSTRRLSPSMLREPSSMRSPGMPNTISSPTLFPAK